MSNTGGYTALLAEDVKSGGAGGSQGMFTGSHNYCIFIHSLGHFSNVFRIFNAYTQVEVQVGHRKKRKQMTSVTW